MSNTDVAIREVVESFVEQLRGLIQQAALESVQAALNGGSVPARRGGKTGRAAVSAPTKGRQKGGKRTAEELEGLVKKLHSHVAKNPGQRIEQIGNSLGVTTKELVLPVRKLVGEKRLASKGQKRATTYYVKKLGTASQSTESE